MVCIFVYVLNLFMVCADLILYIRNTRIDKFEMNKKYNFKTKLFQLRKA